jgi:hypothetical protein
MPAEITEKEASKPKEILKLNTSRKNSEKHRKPGGEKGGKHRASS